MSGAVASELALEAVRRSALDQAAGDAERLRAMARVRAEEMLAAARAEADVIVTSQRAAAERLGEAEERARLAEARAAASAELLSARRTVLLEARAAARTAVAALLQDPRSAHLVERLTSDVRRRLGTDQPVQIVPLTDGGFIARAGPRQIDCSLDSLLDRVLDSLGPEVERLWR